MTESCLESEMQARKRVSQLDVNWPFFAVENFDSLYWAV